MNNDPNEPMKGLTDEERRALQVTCPECGLTEWASVEIWRPSFSMGKLICSHCGHRFHDPKIPISHIQRARRETMERAAREKVRQVVSPLKGAILSTVSRGFTVPDGDSFIDWINETIENDGLEEEEEEETARFRRFFMGETVEEVTLIVHDSDGREKKRFVLEGCRCSDSPLQRLGRGEPPFAELEDGSITVTPGQVSYLRPSGFDPNRFVQRPSIFVDDDEGGDDE